MDARYAIRKTPLLDECQVAPEIFEQVIPRLSTLMEPFVKTFQGQVGAQHAKTYICGLLSDVEHKNVASIAYQPSQPALGTRRWGVGVRSLGISQVRPGVGGCRPSVGWSAGQSRELPSGPGLGIRVA